MIDNYKIFLFTPPRQEIYERVDKRFFKMIDMGIIQEVKKLLSGPRSWILIKRAKVPPIKKK